MSLVRVSSLGLHASAVWDVAWTPTGELLASCSADKTIRIWQQYQHQQNEERSDISTLPTSARVDEQAEQWRCVATLEDGHERTVRRLAWSPDGMNLASCSFDGTVVIWTRNNIRTRSMSDDDECDSDVGAPKLRMNVAATLEGHENEVKGVAWDASGALLATCGRDKTVWIWEMDEEFEFECLAVLHGHTQDVKNVMWHPTREILFSCSYDNTVKIWQDEDDDWFCTHTISAHDSTVWDIAFDTMGDRLATVSDDRDLSIWDVSASLRPDTPSPSRVARVTGVHRRCIYSVDWSAAGYVATGCEDDAIRVFHRQQGTEADALDETYPLVLSLERAHNSDVNCIRWRPGSGVGSAAHSLASCSDDGTVVIWRFTP